MARKAKDTGANGVDAEVMRDAMGQLKECADQLSSEKGRYMQACGVIRQRMAAVYDEAAEKGATKKEMRAIFKASETLAKAKKIIADLENDERDRAGMMADALGDDELAPLFVFAKRRRKRGEAATEG